MTSAIAPKPREQTPGPAAKELERLLARAASKPPRLSKAVRRALADLSLEDRADVLQAAIEWCWPRRHGWDLVTASSTVDKWFFGVVRNMRQQLFRAQAQDAEVEYLGVDDVPQGDTTAARAEALEAAEKLAAALPEDYRRVAQLEAEGYSRQEMIELGVPERTVNEARARLRQLQRLMPEAHEEHKIARPTPPKITSDNIEPWSEPPRIDKEIGAVDEPPNWGSTPNERELPERARKQLKEVDDPDVRAAIERTEARRAAIGNNVAFSV